MPFKFKQGAMYRMPVIFGPALGPRQGPEGRTFGCQENPATTTVSVTFLTNPDQLEELLPERFELGEQPLVTVSASYMTNIEWLAGRGYNVLGVSFPVVFRGEHEIARGPLLTVLWENLADPIITGREELGFSKIYCELPDPEINDDAAHLKAGWLGFDFLSVAVEGLKRQEPTRNSSSDDGTLHYKYIPRTGEWGEADACYPVLTPAACPNRRVLERWSGTGTVRWNRARWEDLPTMYTIVNTFADLEIREYVQGTVEKTVGAKDLSDQRILR